MTYLPITLVGDTLGRRHQYLNRLVNDAYNDKVPFQSIVRLPEATSIDKLFKIDLANKYRNIDYILQCLKDKDMLYVSRALKCYWLVNDAVYSSIIEPKYLEEKQFPKMMLTAKNKMKHWITLNLKDKNRCQQFFDYYRNKDLKYALKFFPMCPSDYITKEFHSVPFPNLTPCLIRLLCKNSSTVAQVLFEKLKRDNISLSEGKYNKAGQTFLSQLHILLKRDPNQFFLMIENFYESNFKRLNKSATKYIMKNHRDRFEAKPELYAAKFLDLSTLSKFLTNDDIKELVIKLVKADYIDSFDCNYKFAEPLLKRMNKKEKPAFCKKIFEEQSYGEKIKKAPYFIPSYRDIKERERPLNYDHKLIDYGPRASCYQQCKLMGGGGRMYTQLDKLFDQNRFKSFEETFLQFKKSIPKESSLENRQSMLLVLVSKSGGRSSSLKILMEFLQRHINEPASLRATIIRSLVKRARAWRLESQSWDQFLKFGYDLGLDGSTPVAPCNEGLHGVILHDILLKGLPSPNVLSVFLRDFVSLSNYSLTNDERKFVVPKLTDILLNDAKAKPDFAPKRFTEILDMLDSYRLCLKQYPEVVSAIKIAIHENPQPYRSLLQRIYKLKSERRTFFNENFEIMQGDESFLNALKHDIRVLEKGDKFDALLEADGAKRLQKFLSKLLIYFGEEDGLADKYYVSANHKILQENPKVGLARTIALLTGTSNLRRAQEMRALLIPVDVKKMNRLTAALCSNIHLARPKPFFDLYKMKGKSGLATANYIHTCNQLELKEEMPMLLRDPKLARQVLSLRAAQEGTIAETLTPAARGRRMVALRIALRILRRHGHAYQNKDWCSFKQLIQVMDFINKKKDTYLNLAKIDAIPERYRLEYSILIYQVLEKANLGSDNGPSYSMTMAILPYIYDNIQKANVVNVNNMIKNFLDNHFSTTKLASDNYRYIKYVTEFVPIISSFVLLSKSDTEQSDRLENFVRLFFDKLKAGWKGTHTRMRWCLEAFAKSLTNPTADFNCFQYSLALRSMILNFNDEVIPLNEDFGSNIEMRFSMLFSSALKKSITDEPQLLQKENMKSERFREILAKAFANIVSKDVDELISTYFHSIVGIYSQTLRKYLYSISYYKRDYFELQRFHSSFVKNLLQEKQESNGLLLGVLLYARIDWDNEECFEELIKIIDDDNMKLLLANRELLQ